MPDDSSVLDPGVLRRKGRPNLERAADIDRAIRDAALDVLMEHGEAATLHAVAQTAGISRKSLYARYANKSDLFIDVIRDLLTEPASIACDSSGPFERRLHALIRRTLDVVSARKSLAIQRLLAIDPADIRALRPDMRAASRQLLVQPLTRLLREATARGEIAPRDIEATARAIVALILAESRGCAGESTTDRAAWQDHTARFLTDFACRGLSR